jgi:lipopolysaccharide/colanic/teichoic acid biosynthesis glycosyltransferase
VGDFEEGDPVDEAVRCDLESEPGVIFAGMVKDIPKYYAAMEVLAFPTRREGFGLVSIEAQAAGVPVVTTRVTGAMDSVLDGVTGNLVAAQDADALAEALIGLLGNPEKRKQMGNLAATWVEGRFRREAVWEALIADYDRMVKARQKSAYQRWGKHVFDFVVACAALLVLSPLLLLIALVIWLRMGAPVLFKQERPGLNTVPFSLMKFRTMTSAKSDRGELLPDAERLTTLGKILRKTSLDELPELWNVLRGDMSLVGPRPLLVRYVPFFTKDEQQRFSVRPGITGLAQVEGRNHANWDARIALDREYVEKCSLRLDLLLLWKTMLVVFRGSGVEVDPGAAMLDFDEERRRRAAENGPH